MGLVGKTLKVAGVAVLAAVVGGAGYLYVAPPDLLRVGAGYAAKIVCSNVFIAGRDPDAVLSIDVQAPGNPILKFLDVSVDRDNGLVAADFLGFVAKRYAINRPGYGCTVLDNGPEDIALLPELPALPVATPSDKSQLWPQGEAVGSPEPAVAALIADNSLAGPDMRAIVVIQHGRIIAETYGEGFDPATPLIGWSMTKTVNGALLGLAQKRGLLSLDDTGLFDAWANDDRNAINLQSMAAMQSGLAFNEDYGDVSDVTRMLYLEHDMAGFAVSQPAAEPSNTAFHYSTGTSVAISRYWQNKAGANGWTFPHDALFSPLGMTSAVLETDATGTFVGGSYLYATAHDWARFGEFLLRGGIWNGEQLLPADFAALFHTPSKVSNGRYSLMQSWFEGPDSKPGSAFGLPEDTMWLKGHDGQSVAIVPSRDLVMVRMGLTPSRLHYHPQELLKQVLDVLKS